MEFGLDQLRTSLRPASKRFELSRCRSATSLGPVCDQDSLMEFGLKQRTILPISRRPNFTKCEHNTSIGIAMNPFGTEF